MKDAKLDEGKTAYFSRRFPVLLQPGKEITDQPLFPRLRP
jgi:hypothetical protein